MLRTTISIAARASAGRSVLSGRANNGVIAVRHASDEHHEETYEQFTERYVRFFATEADDVFELSRGLTNCFATDLVPAPEVVVAALKAARRLNSFPLAARTIEALRDKIGNDSKTYAAYVDELKPTLAELGVPTPEDLGR